MNAFLLLVFAAASCSLVAWGLRRPGRIYQYPFLAGAVWVGWLLPQAVGLVSDATLPAGGYALTMLMAILCVAATFVGHNSRPQPLRAFAWRFHPHRLLIGAIVLSLFGSLFSYLLRDLPEEMLRSMGGAWTGLPVMYVFLTQAQVIGFGIAALIYAKTRAPLALVVCIYDLAWFADLIILGGRRTFTIEVLLIILLSAWFARRWIISRWMAGCGVGLATLAVTSIGYWRGLTNSAYGSMGARLPTWEEFSSIDFVGNFLKTTESGAHRAELYNAVYNIAAMQLTAAYDLGLSYWNVLVFRFVPAQLFGSAFKDSLTFSLPDQALLVFGFVPHPGATHTGLSDSFGAFWLFGALVFFVIARIMRKLYDAGMRGHTVAQIGYMLLCGHSLLAITHGSVAFFAGAIHCAAFVLPVLAWAKIRPQSRTFRPQRRPQRQQAHANPIWMDR